MHKRNLLFAAAAAAAAFLLPASAGLRPWEPSDYVDDSLVLHYDGIRNAGAGAAHDPAATTWKDLSPSGNDASTYIHSSASDNGAWGAKGFVFATDSYWQADARTSLTGDFTMQVACDTTQSSMQGTKSWPNLIGNNGAGGSGNNDELTIFYHKNNKQLSAKVLNAYVGGSSTTSGYRLGDWNLRYATLVRQGSTANFFDGIAPVKTGTSIATTPIGADILIGSGTTDKNDSGSGDRRFTGTIYSVRIYAKALSNAELAWNRALDEARFRGAASVPESALCASVIPDAVVATSVAGANGAESVGCYVVDDDGHTFRAAPFATVGAATYACTGYTLATWNGSAYGTAVAHDGEFACFVAPGDKVRIEWQWETATGSLDAGYVTNGLAIRLDGIDNAGVGVHNASAAVWKDLSGNGRDATLAGNADGSSHWEDKGFCFNFNAVFSTVEKFAFGTQHTFEILMDGKRSDWWGDNQEKDIIVPSTGPTGAGGIYYKAANEILCHRSDATTGSAWNAMPGFYRLNTVTYLAALRDNAKTALITGTTYPETEYDVANGGIAASQNYVTNAWLVGSKNLVADPTTWLVGGRTTAPANTTKGTVKSVRLYNRLLTEEELAHNRAVDEARFFGKIPETGCVVVQSAIAGLEGREPSGTYFPDGWTFSAGAGTQTARGIEWECAGYQLQTWDADASAWGAQQTVLRNGENAVEYTAAATSAALPSVRLTWLWKPVSGIRTAADYALADYAVGGLQLHLDGLLNTGAAHDSSATVWSDLSGNGRDATLAGNASGESHWAADGYFFANNAVFNTAASFSLGHHYTMQVLADAKNEDHRSHNGVFVMPSSGWGYGGIYYKNDGNQNVYHRTDSVTSAAWNDMAGLRETARMTYLTGLRDGTKVALVSGTSYPATTRTFTGEGVDWYVTTGWLDGTRNDVAAADTWRIGASTAGGGGDALYGTIKSVRLYDRLLSEGELAWNRSVDSARFFGALPTTNVVVVANEYSGLAADTAYEVFGSTTFEPAVSGANFVRVKTLRQDGTWGDTRSVEGAFYAYDPATDGTVMIEFRKTNPFVIVVR